LIKCLWKLATLDLPHKFFFLQNIHLNLFFIDAAMHLSPQDQEKGDNSPQKEEYFYQLFCHKLCHPSP
jgi:hypothetical protein